MKLIDIMKRYNKCILKENAKLRSIYNTLIRECDGADAENECDVSGCDGKEENECDTNEAEGTKMSIAEFLGECGKEGGAKEGEDSADDSSKKKQIDEVNDDDLMTAEEFFGGGKTKADECDACGDDSCKNGEKCGLKEGEDEIDEDEELISKKEFYATNESDNEDETNEDEEIDEEVEEEITEEDGETNEDEDTEKDVTESKKDNKETELSESLEDHYRAANRKLFNI